MRRSVQAWFGLLCIGAVAVAGSITVPSYPNHPGEPAATPRRDALRYDGKPFSYWRDCWRTELKASRRVYALEALASFGMRGYAREATAAILDMVSQYDKPESWRGADGSAEPEPVVLTKVDWALDKIGDAALPVLIEALHHRDRGVRHFVADRVLGGNVGGVSPTFAPNLIRTVETGNRDSAGLAASVLCYVHGIETVLSKMQRTPHESAAFVDALARLVVADPTEADNYEGSTSATALLAQMGAAARTAEPALARAWQSPDHALKAMSALALANMNANPKRMIPSFEAALTDKDEAIRAVAARCLGFYGARAEPAAPALRKALEDSNDCVRLAALLALGTIENNPHRTLDAFVKASGVSGDPGSLADLIGLAAADKAELSDFWLGILWDRHSHSTAFADREGYRLVLAHADVAPGVRKALPVIKEAIRLLKLFEPLLLADPVPPPPLVSFATPADALKTAIANALKKTPLASGEGH